MADSTNLFEFNNSPILIFINMNIIAVVSKLCSVIITTVYRPTFNYILLKLNL
jgi:hypothetical protein